MGDFSFLIFEFYLKLSPVLLILIFVIIIYVNYFPHRKGIMEKVFSKIELNYL